MIKSEFVTAWLLASSLAFCAHAAAEDVRYYEEGGVTYCERRHIVQRPVVETRYEQRDRTVYREQYTTETQETQRLVHVPVTEYRWEAYWRNRFNPFAQPYLDQRLVPRTHWEVRTETVQTPIVRRQLVPEIERQQVPVVTRRMVEEERISRVAVTGPGTGGTYSQPVTSVADARNRIGGVTNLDRDPPRYQSAPSWRPATDTIRR